MAEQLPGRTARQMQVLFAYMPPPMEKTEARKEFPRRTEDLVAESALHSNGKYNLPAVQRNAQIQSTSRKTMQIGEKSVLPIFLSCRTE